MISENNLRSPWGIYSTHRFKLNQLSVRHPPPNLPPRRLCISETRRFPWLLRRRYFRKRSKARLCYFRMCFFVRCAAARGATVNRDSRALTDPHGSVVPRANTFLLLKGRDRLWSRSVIMNSEIELGRCASPLCGCHVSEDQRYCSDACQIPTGYQCHCDHLACNSAAALAWQTDAPSFYGGRLL